MDLRKQGFPKERRDELFLEAIRRATVSACFVHNTHSRTSAHEAPAGRASSGTKPKGCFWVSDIQSMNYSLDLLFCTRMQVDLAPLAISYQQSISLDGRAFFP